MKKLIVVLMGGISGERDISFLSGKACSKALKKKGYKDNYIIVHKSLKNIFCIWSYKIVSYDTGYHNHQRQFKIITFHIKHKF